MMKWNTDMKAPPYATLVEVRAGGMEFVAQLLRDNAMNDQEQPVDQWCAATETYPACRSEGCCWESNADEVMSAQPEAWRYLDDEARPPRQKTTEPLTGNPIRERVS